MEVLGTLDLQPGSRVTRLGDHQPCALELGLEPELPRLQEEWPELPVCCQLIGAEVVEYRQPLPLELVSVADDDIRLNNRKNRNT